MSSDRKILAVVVTHNRCALLERCLEHLRSQTRPPDEVIVVDSGSTDGTTALLRDRGVRFVTVVDSGSAAGWHRGISLALDEGADAVWLMGDRGYPALDALAKLEAALPGTACVSSVLVREDDSERFVLPHPVLDGRGFPVLLHFKRKLRTLSQLARLAPIGTYPFAHFFNGALISVDAIRRIGNVNRDFFTLGEEVDYFFRLRRVGPVLSVLAARQYCPASGAPPYTPAKIYYYVKNTLVLNRRYLDRTFGRNLLTAAAALSRTALRNGPCEALSYVAGRKAPVFYRAISRGLSGKVGMDLDE